MGICIKLRPLGVHGRLQNLLAIGGLHCDVIKGCFFSLFKSIFAICHILFLATFPKRMMRRDLFFSLPFIRRYCKLLLFPMQLGTTLRSPYS